jgi:hypothetical protein
VTMKFLNDDDLAALLDFNECCSDSDAGGYSTRRPVVKRLAEIGVLQNLNFGVYGITAFGQWVIENHYQQPTKLPL